MQYTRKGHVRRIHALKRIIHTPKAHRTQQPIFYAVYSEVAKIFNYNFAQRSNALKKCIY